MTHNTTRLKPRAFLYRLFSAFIAFTFACNLIIPPQIGFAQTILNLPSPGEMIMPSTAFTPPLIKGIIVHPENPLKFDFIIDVGDKKLDQATLRQEALKIMKYFMASVTLPQEDMWVNLSPYEKDRIVTPEFGVTEMGKDLLSQDYILKQLTASLMYPESELGQKFWQKVYAKVQSLYGTTNIPITTFNKVWIVPDKAVVHERKNSAFVVESHLKVMLEGDYLALQENMNNKKLGTDQMLSTEVKNLHNVSSDIVKEMILPEIEKEVNEGQTFANLRQIYNAEILAYWYKTALKTSILGQVYANKKKVKGVDVEDKEMKQKIYQHYLDAFKTGVYNYIKEDTDPVTQKTIPRKYFSGGAIAVQDVQSVDEDHMTREQRLALGSTHAGGAVQIGMEVAGVRPGAKAEDVRQVVDESFAAKGQTPQIFIDLFLQELETGLKAQAGNDQAQLAFVNTMRAKLEAEGWLDQEHLKPVEKRIPSEVHSTLATAIDTLSLKIAGLSKAVKDSLSQLLAKDVNTSCNQCDWAAKNKQVVAENIVETLRNRHAESGSQIQFTSEDERTRYLQRLADAAIEQRGLGNIGLEEGLDTPQGIRSNADAIIVELRAQETALRQSPAADDQIIADSLLRMGGRIDDIATTKISEHYGNDIQVTYSWPELDPDHKIGSGVWALWGRPLPNGHRYQLSIEANKTETVITYVGKEGTKEIRLPGRHIMRHGGGPSVTYLATNTLYFRITDGNMGPNSFVNPSMESLDIFPGSDWSKRGKPKIMNTISFGLGVEQLEAFQAQSRIDNASLTQVTPEESQPPVFLTDAQFTAEQTLDSRRRPTVKVTLRVGDNEVVGYVPAGASKGGDEADTVGVAQAILNINNVLVPLLQRSGLDLRKHEDLVQMDRLMAQAAGDNFKDLGADAVVPLSWGLWKMAARLHNMELYKYMRTFELEAVSDKKELVYFYMNVYNGGLHAVKEGEELGRDRIHFQEIMVVPVGATSYAQALEMGDKIDQALKEILAEHFADEHIARADEAGFSVKGLGDTSQAIDYVFQAIERAGYKAGTDVKLALDTAASTFDRSLEKHGEYNFLGRTTADEMIEYYIQLAEKYEGKILSIEDGLAENDWEGWKKLKAKMKEYGVETIGDDLFVTQMPRLNKGIEEDSASSILIKVNQNGTLTGTFDVIKRAKRAGMKWVVSHRSGETPDDAIADLAEGTNALGLKTGDPQPDYDFDPGQKYAINPPEVRVRRVKYERMVAVEDAGSRRGIPPVGGAAGINPEWEQWVRNGEVERFLELWAKIQHPDAKVLKDEVIAMLQRLQQEGVTYAGEILERIQEQKTFAETLKELRNEKGLTRRELGEKIGLGDLVHTVPNWERGESRPTPGNFKKLDEFFEGKILNLKLLKVNERNTFGAALLKLRLSRGLTQQGLGEKIGLTGGIVAHWEKGEGQPNFGDLERLDKFFEGEVLKLLKVNERDTFQTALLKLRLSRGLSKQDLGWRIGFRGKSLPSVMVSNWETGKQLPSSGDLERLDKFFEGEVLKLLKVNERDTFGAGLLKLRLSRGLTQQELGEKIGYRWINIEKKVSSWETGESLPELDDFERLDKFFEGEVLKLLKVNERDTFGTGLLKLRLSRGLTQQELGEALGFKGDHARVMVYNWETGKKFPNSGRLKKLDEFFRGEVLKSLKVNERNTFGAGLLKLRLSRGLTQQELGEEIGLTGRMAQASVSAWETGKGVKLSPNDLKKLDEFFGGEGDLGSKLSRNVMVERRDKKFIDERRARLVEIADGLKGQESLLEIHWKLITTDEKFSDVSLNTVRSDYNLQRSAFYHHRNVRVRKGQDAAVNEIGKEDLGTPEGGPTALGEDLQEKVQATNVATANFDPTQVGGINLRLNPALLDFQIKRDGNGIPLPINQQPIGDMKIEGFIPIFLYEKPISLPLLLSSLEEQPANSSSPTQQRRTSKTKDPMDLSYSSPLFDPKKRFSDKVIKRITLS